MAKEKFISLLSTCLNNSHIDYALLDFNTSTVEGEVSLIISEKEYKKISSLVYNFSKNNNFFPVQKLKDGTTSALYTFSSYDNIEEKFIYIQLNVWSDFKIGGRFNFFSEELLANRIYIEKSDYYKLNDTYAFIYYLIKNINSQRLSQEQFLQLSRYWEDDNRSLVVLLQRFFSGNSITIIRNCFEKKDFNYLSNNLSLLRNELHEKFPLRLKDILTNKLRQVKYTLKPSGLVVGVLGRDGAGKSTFINELSVKLSPYFVETITFKKFPSILYKGAIFKKSEPHDNTKPHYYKERGVIASFLKLNIILFDFMFGYWIKIFPFKAKSHLIFYDRYFIDILADPLRYRIKKNKFFIKAYHYILPKPDIWIILDLPSDVLLKRKQELNYELAEKLRYEYLNLQSLLKNSIVINNEGEIKDTLNEASSFILNYMNKKY